MSSPPSGFSVPGSAKAPVNPEAEEGGSSSNPNVQNVPLTLSPINVVAPIMAGQQHPSTHALFKIKSSLTNLISMAPLVAQSAQNLLLEGGEALPTDTWYGHDFIRDVQLFQRNICIFSDAIGVINSQDVVITKVGEMQCLVHLKIAGLWNEAVINAGLGSACYDISQLALKNNITVRAI